MHRQKYNFYSIDVNTLIFKCILEQKLRSVVVIAIKSIRQFISLTRRRQSIVREYRLSLVSIVVSNVLRGARDTLSMVSVETRRTCVVQGGHQRLSVSVRLWTTPSLAPR